MCTLEFSAEPVTQRQLVQDLKVYSIAPKKVLQANAQIRAETRLKKNLPTGRHQQ